MWIMIDKHCEVKNSFWLITPSGGHLKEELYLVILPTYLSCTDAILHFSLSSFAMSTKLTKFNHETFQTFFLKWYIFVKILSTMNFVLVLLYSFQSLCQLTTDSSHFTHLLLIFPIFCQLTSFYFMLLHFTSCNLL